MKIMYQKLLSDLKFANLLNADNKISPWLERKITEPLRNRILDATDFLEGEITLANRIQTMILGITEQPKCLSCSKPTRFFKEYKNFAKYCSKECSNTSEEKSEKHKQAYKDGKLSVGKYAAEIQRKKYDGLLAIQSDPSIQEKMKATTLERFGVDNYFKTDAAKDVVRVNREKYKRDFERNLNISKELLNTEYTINGKTIDQCSNIFKCSPMYIWKKLYDYEIPINYNWSSSSHEKELVEYLTELNINFIANDRKLISPKEVDIYIQEYNIAIEINGLWCHHDGVNDRGRNYHKEKSLSCQEKGVDLIQFYDTEWITKNNICKSIITSRLNLNEKIYARNCEIRLVDEIKAKHFLDDNHIQGSIRAKHRIGLFYENELVSLMTFGNDRFNKNSNATELYRFCNKIGISVVGGASKLFNYFASDEEKIISYCDIRLFTGILYEKLGFKLSHYSDPGYHYFNSKSYKLEHRLNYQLHKLPNILENFDPNLTEYENMKLNKFFRVWDCGNKVYIYQK